VRGSDALIGAACRAGALVLTALWLSVWGQASLAHELPTFPRVRLLAVEPHPREPAVRIVAVEVRDPGGRQPVAGAGVSVSGLERERGSAVRLRDQWLAATPQPGVYQGPVEFPGAGLWDLTVTVRGEYVGEAHFEVRVTGEVGRAAARGGQPELAFGWPGWRLLLLNWGHLLGFGLWVGVTALALTDPGRAPRATVTLTWLALAVGIGTGFTKMEYGTPFPRGLRLLDWDVPRIFFGREYLYMLTTKHALIITAIGVTAGLTREAWRAAPPNTSRRWLRTLLLVNLVLAVAIAGAAAVLDLLHGIVLHFS